jgi:hypothetical protein
MAQMRKNGRCRLPIDFIRIRTTRVLLAKGKREKEKGKRKKVEGKKVEARQAAGETPELQCRIDSDASGMFC